MQVSLHQLHAICQSDAALTAELISALDQLTHSLGKTNDAGTFVTCQQAWHMISQSRLFWENVSRILSFVTHDETKLQVVLLIERKVKLNWINENNETKGTVKNFVCEEAKKYHQEKTLTPERKSYFLKINSTIAEILKYQWTNEWKGFLHNICEAMLSEPVYAENYLNLLKIIFEQIFNQGERLTSKEIKTLKHNLIIGDNFSIIQNVFETYLKGQCPRPIITNSLKALQSLLQWIPPYYIYYGHIIDNVVALIQNPHHETEALECLLYIFRLEEDKEESLKLNRKKRGIIIEIMKMVTIDSEEQQIEEVLGLMMEYMRKEIKIISDPKQRVNDENYHKETVQICQKALEFVQILDNHEEFTSLFAFVSRKMQVEDLETVIKYLIQMAPCPVDPNFFIIEKLYKDEISGQKDEDYQADYIQMLRNFMVDSSAYFNALLGHIGKKYKNLRELKYLCKVCWNFYYFLECSQEKKIYDKVMFFLVPIMDRYEQLEQVMVQKRSHALLEKKIMQTLRACITIILSHARVHQADKLAFSFMEFIVKGFREETNLCKITISCLSNCFVKLSDDIKQLITARFLHTTQNREDKYELHLYFCETLRNKNREKNQADPRTKKSPLTKSMLALGQYWRTLYLSKREDIVQSSDQCSENLNNRKISLFEQVTKCINIVRIIVDLGDPTALKSLESTLEQIMDWSSFCYRDLYGGSAPINLACCYENLLVSLSWLFSSYYNSLGSMQTYFEEKKVQIMEQACQLCELYTNLLTKQGNQINEQNENLINCSLHLLASIARSTNLLPLDLGYKKELLTKLTCMVAQIQYGVNTPGYGEYMEACISSKAFNLLPSQISSKLAFQIFEFSKQDSEQFTAWSLKMMKSLIGHSSFDDVPFMSFFHHYLLDFISHTLLGMLRTNPASEMINDYAEIIFLTKSEARKMAIVNPTLKSNNTVEIMIRIEDVLRNQLGGANEEFIQKLLTLFKQMWELTVLEEFKSEMRDFGVIYHRRY